MATIRRYFGVIGFCALALCAPRVAHAQTTGCTNDVDCPDPDCGGQVCDWSTTPHSCKPAGTYPQGQDGWCTVTSDCKCASEGATCASIQCTRTLPQGGASGTSGGASGIAGSSAAGSSAAGSSAAGTASSTDSSGSSGCSMSGGAPRGSFGFALGVVGAAALIGARRRRRAG